MGGLLAEALGSSGWAGSLSGSESSTEQHGPMLSMDKNGVFHNGLPMTNSLGLAYLFFFFHGPRMVAYTFDPSTQEMGVGRSL